ncbi:Prolyl 4-hydroxylase alpha subunit [Penicillium cf. griseofulvum]|uniref:Prolyl 4-hydroxylase alpha subunit n=1 Tax=Penicillium cf. griseofulvum TaxID=2972120 RepID=A0A9W9J4S2_9EURO|nr:Prolyl 4-hydroxylase alpha subunit [Penicillium cf. griseofulvum]KAJ5434054.1 Prolyl 4-hydroxylase alpha subunit [Penicillium cf. griseofulvum]KAJ5451886.1 Prolyl 4-hydroxylase alpha subunit [Penicillium cf. griseofulvum]
MAVNAIERFHVTIPLSVQFESNAQGVHVVGVSMPEERVSITGIDDQPSIAQTNFEPDDKVWPDGLQDLGLVAANESLACPDFSHIEYFTLHEDPLIIYIPNFVSPDEIAHLLETTKETFTPSVVYRQGVSSSDENFRKSENAWPPRDEVLQCIEQRAIRYQNSESKLLMEQLSLQLYRENGFFSYHHDQFDSPPNRLNRYSTYNVFLQGDCTGGGTHFPLIPRPTESAWCNYIDCESTQPGVIFKPIAGSAVYWVNIREDGLGYRETLHAGMPVTSGTKIGMNIWSWKDTREDVIQEETLHVQ